MGSYDYDQKWRNSHSKYDSFPKTFQNSSQFLPKLPQSSGFDDIERISPSLRCSRYPVIPPLTPPDDRHHARQGDYPPHFPHNSYDPPDDPYGISHKLKTRPYQRSYPSSAEQLESFRFQEAFNPVHVDRSLAHFSPHIHNRRVKQDEAKNLKIAARDIAVDILEETTSDIVQSVAEETSIMAKKRLWQIYSEDSRYYHPSFTSVYDDVLNEELRAIIKEVVNEMVTDYFKLKATTNDPDIKNIEKPEFLWRNIPEIFTEVFQNDLSDEIYNDALSSVVHDVIQSQLMSEVKSNSVSQTNLSSMTNFVIDGLQLDHLLMKLTNHRQVWNDSEVKDMLLDSTLASELTHLLKLLSNEGQSSCDVVPLKRFHENITTDYSLDLLLNELSISLDEDLEDLFEYEYIQEMTAKHEDQTR
ncbi:uncharacterized protein [Antedon mediterranea]|uniref:uncharacterized protein n=1 Tax=Antedon mediterranea TaxID=105859 RepID=UPI003AF7C3EB